MYYRAAYTL